MHPRASGYQAENLPQTPEMPKKQPLLCSAGDIHHLCPPCRNSDHHLVWLPRRVGRVCPGLDLGPCAEAVPVLAALLRSSTAEAGSASLCSVCGHMCSQVQANKD